MALSRLLLGWILVTVWLVGWDLIARGGAGWDRRLAMLADDACLARRAFLLTLFERPGLHARASSNGYAPSADGTIGLSTQWPSIALM